MGFFSRPLFTIIFRPEMLKFQPYSILTGDTMVGFVIFCVLRVVFIGTFVRCSETSKYGMLIQVGIIIWDFRVFLYV